MCLPVLTPKAILSREDGGKQEVSQLLEVLHPQGGIAGNQMSLVGGRKQGVWGHPRCRGSKSSRLDLGVTQRGTLGPIPGCLEHSRSALNSQGPRVSLHTVRFKVWLRRFRSEEAYTLCLDAEL